jgi:predicted permease
MLDIRSLTKYYDHTPAVRDVSFTIQPGEILGYLGANGAGKSTTVKMLTGLIEPSQGQILLDGRSVRNDIPGYLKRIGYVPEEAHVYPHLSGWEYLQLMGRLRGIERHTLEPKIDEFIRLFSLWDARHDPLSSYSKGMRQKILLSSALLHNPDILILDEPFSGLDVTSAMVLRRLIRGMAQQGKMILYSSHVLEVVEKVCSKVLILKKGEVVAYDSIDRLRDLMCQPSLEGVFAQLAETEDSDSVAQKILDAMGDGNRVAAEARQRAPETGLRIYRTVAGAMPQEFQNVHGDEMLQTAEEAIAPVWRNEGKLGMARLLLDLAIRIPTEYLFEFRKDLRYAIRMLVKSPGFTAVALISLTLGACIATCALSEMNGMLWRDIPLAAKPQELVALQQPVSYPDYQRYRDRSEVFASTMAYIAPAPFSLSLGGRTERIWGHLITPSYFSTLGVRPEWGSFFPSGDDRRAEMPAVVVSHRFWQAHFGADQRLLGKTLLINGQSVELIGIAPEGFRGASPLLYPADLWMTLSGAARIAPELAGNTLERRDRQVFRITGRLKPGVAIPAAEAALDTTARAVEQDYSEPDRRRGGRRVGLVDGGKLLQFRKQDKPLFTSFFLLIAGLMVLIPCTSVANMMLARANSRRREIGVRLALGASRGRLIRQLLTESMIIAAIAGALGLLGSMWLMRALSLVKMPFASPVDYDFRPDGRVLLCSLGLMVFTGLAFGLVPAMQATRAGLLIALKDGNNFLVSRSRRLSLRNLLIVSQVAGALTLLTVLGFQSFGIQTTLRVQQGFDPKNLFLLTMDPVRDGVSGEQSAALLEKVLDRVKSLPSVTSAALTQSVPVSMPGAPLKMLRPVGPDSRTVANAIKHVVGRDYFDATGIRILEGRAFLREDEAAGAGKVIVSEALAHEFWPGMNPLGRTIEVPEVTSAPGGPAMLPSAIDDRPAAVEDGRRVFEVVGVARDVAEGLTVQKPRPTVYFPLSLADYRKGSMSGLTLIVRARGDADVLTAIIREISGVSASLTPFDARSMQEQIERFMSPLRIASWSYSMIWIFGVILAAVGLAGVTAYSVTCRRHEIGIRMALGAHKNDVLSLVMKDGAILIAAGMGLGLAAAWAATRMLAAINSTAGQVTATSTSNPIVLVGAPVLLAILALIACYLPARRSLRIDPMCALRQE